MTPLHQLKDGVPASSNFLFSPRPTRRIALPQSFPYHPGQGKNYRMVGGEIVPFYEDHSPNGNVRHTYLTAGENPPRGVSVTYVMNDKPRGEVKLTFLDSLGHVIKQFSSRTDQGQSAPVQPGMNCFIWDMRYPDAEGITSMEGPIAPPGDYQVQLYVGDAIYTQTFQIIKDPRVTASLKKTSRTSSTCSSGFGTPSRKRTKPWPKFGKRAAALKGGSESLPTTNPTPTLPALPLA